MKRLAKAVLSSMGYVILKKDGTRWNITLDPDEFEAQAHEAIAKVRNQTMLSDDKLTSLLEQVKYCEKAVQGCYVECGVWKGGGAALMGIGNLLYGSERRHLRLFDAFDAIPEPDPLVDGARAAQECELFAGRKRETLSGKLKPVSGFYDHKGGPGTIEEVKSLMRRIGYPDAFVHYHEGWFQDTIPLANTGPIAILRLDGDWYASTKVCLDHLYESVVTNGFIIIDDYGAYAGCRRAVDEFRAAHRITSFMHRVDRDCRYWIKDAE